MSSLDTLTVPALDDDPGTAGARHCPSLGAVVRRVGLSLLIACAIPAALFYTCFRLNGVWTAIFVALGWSYGAIAWRALTGRRASGLLILTALVMTARTLIALLTDSTFLYFLQPIITDGVFGAVFLLSLAHSRPMVARLAGDFYPMDDELSLRPRIQQLFWYLTLMWGLLCAGKAMMTLWLLLSQSLDTFVLVKSVAILAINGLAIATTIALSVAVGRKEGLLGPVPEPVPVPVAA
jgi:hypothetical protein